MNAQLQLVALCYDRHPHDHERAESLRNAMMEHPPFTLAWHLYRLGFSILPVVGKRPVRKWKELQTTRCSVSDLVDWFYDNEFTPGIITGELSGIVVVDCDNEDAVDDLLDATICGGSGEESMVRQHTQRGTHFVYRHPGGRCANQHNCNGQSMDIRGDGGYVVAYGESMNWTAESIATAPRLNSAQFSDAMV